MNRAKLASLLLLAVAPATQASAVFSTGFDHCTVPYADGTLRLDFEGPDARALPTAVNVSFSGTANVKFRDGTVVPCVKVVYDNTESRDCDIYLSRDFDETHADLREPTQCPGMICKDQTFDVTFSYGVVDRKFLFGEYAINAPELQFDGWGLPNAVCE